MKLYCTALDNTTLPAELLADAKSHLRVEFNRDDSYIEQCISRAISEVEGVTDLSVFGATWHWSPDETICGTAKIPHSPMTDILVMSGVDDVTADFEISGTDSVLKPGTSWITPVPSGLDVTLTVGYTAAADLPAAVQNPLLLVVGTLYEQREQSLQGGSVMLMPDWLTRMLTNLWRARV